VAPVRGRKLDHPLAADAQSGHPLVQDDRRAVLHRLVGELGDEVAGEDLHVAGDIEDLLLRIHGDQAAAHLRVHLDELRFAVPQARIVGRVQAYRTGSDDGDVVHFGLADHRGIL